MTKDKMMNELKARRNKARSAWERGVILYAIDLLNNLDEGDELTRENLLNGARDWKEYSEGGCSLIYNEDICLRLCAPWEMKRTKYGVLPPNKSETWLDVQARALYQAVAMLMRISK